MAILDPTKVATILNIPMVIVNNTAMGMWYLDYNFSRSLTKFSLS